MSDEEIRKTIRGFIDEVFYDCMTREAALDIKRRYDEFVQKNHVTSEQRYEFAQSGAGEMLYMVASAPLEEEDVDL